MSLKKLHPFPRMLIGAFGGAISGSIAGFILANGIYYVSTMMATAQFEGPDNGMATFLGMGLGAVIGSILGGNAINKQ